MKKSLEKKIKSSVEDEISILNKRVTEIREDIKAFMINEILYKVNTQIDKAIGSIEQKMESEKFIDELIERINRKQLKK